MSLSPVIGTDVPETANGVVTSVSTENGPHIPVVVKCGGSRLPCPGQESEDGPGQTDNHMDRLVYDVKGRLDAETDINERTSSLSLYATGDSDTHVTEELPGAALPWDSALFTQAKDSDRQTERQTETDGQEEEDGEREKQDEEEDEKKWRKQNTAGRREEEVSHRQLSRHYSSSAPGPSTSSSSSPPPPLLPSDDTPCPPHVMAQVWVRNVRGMQDSKSLDEISQACGGGSGARGGGRGGQSEGRRATISSALELEGTVSHEGDLTNFITKNLEQKIKMSSKPSLDCSDSDCSGPIYRSRGLTRRPADIPPIDPTVLVDLQRHTQDVAHSVEMMMRSLNGTIQNMTALSVGYIQTYRDSVDSLGESVDMSIKGMYTLMARCEELDRSMQPIHTLAAQIRDIKRTLDALEAICK